MTVLSLSIAYFSPPNLLRDDRRDKGAKPEEALWYYLPGNKYSFEIEF
jgi:hypothetical protein